MLCIRSMQCACVYYVTYVLNSIMCVCACVRACMRVCVSELELYLARAQIKSRTKFSYCTFVRTCVHDSHLCMPVFLYYYYCHIL